MSVILATTEEVKAYYASEDLGQSKLKLLLEGISSFNKEFDSSAEHFLIGSAVDCILTSTEEDFKESYYVSEIESKPSEAIVSILNHVFEEVVKDYAEYLEVILPDSDIAVPERNTLAEFAGELANWETYVLDGCALYVNPETKKQGYQNNWGPAAKVKAIVEPGSAYFIDLCKSFGKKILSRSQATLINSIVNSLRTNPRTARFFDRTSLQEFRDVVMYYQLPLYFTHKGVKCKALLDMAVVEYEPTGDIVRVTGIDLKTMHGNTFNFISSLKKRRYDIQGAWYNLALEKHFGITPEPFQFVVESTTSVGKPLHFVLENSLLEIGKNGRKAISLVDSGTFTEEKGASPIIAYPIAGYEELLDMYIYHIENGFNEEREVQEADFEPLKLNWNGIMPKE